MKYHTIWSINQNIYNYDITRYISTFIFYKPITRTIMLLKIKNSDFEDMKDGYGSIENWNVSNITDMSSMFYYCTNFNQDISKWNVSNVTNMSCMFFNCINFNKDISKWNVSNVTDMKDMFYCCYNFNQDLSKWNISNVTDMSGIFDFCEKLTIKPTWSET